MDGGTSAPWEQLLLDRGVALLHMSLQLREFSNVKTNLEVESKTVLEVL